MGNKLPVCCLKCFRGDRARPASDCISVAPLLPNEGSPTIEEPLSVAKAVIELETLSETGGASLSKYAPDVDAAHTLAMSLVTDLSLPLLVDTGEVQVYGKTSERGYFLKSVWQSQIPNDRIIAFVKRYEHRPKWDGNLVECRVVGAEGGLMLTYHRMKKVFTVAPRDFIVASKSYTHGNTLIEVATSVTNANFPPVDNVIRAKIYFGAFSAERLPSGCTKVVTVTEIDFGGALPRALMMQMSARYSPSYVKTLIAGLTKDES